MRCCPGRKIRCPHTPKPFEGAPLHPRRGWTLPPSPIGIALAQNVPAPAPAPWGGCEDTTPPIKTRPEPFQAPCFWHAGCLCAFRAHPGPLPALTPHGKARMGEGFPVSASPAPRGTAHPALPVFGRLASCGPTSPGTLHTPPTPKGSIEDVVSGQTRRLATAPHPQLPSRVRVESSCLCAPQPRG